MRKDPPFELTNRIIIDVAEIAELVGWVSSTDCLSSNPALRRSSQIRTIYGSLAIEQNTLTLNQEAGAFRSRSVGVVNQSGEIVHFGTLPQYIPEAVENLLN